MSNIFLMILTAVFAENIIFTRLYGASPFIKGSDRPRKALLVGVSVTVAMTVASVLTYAVYHLVLIPVGLEYLRTVAFVIVIAALAELAGLLLRRFVPAFYESLGSGVHLITVNCAVMGVALVNIQEQNSFAESVGFGLLSGLGFTVAILVFAGVREKMRFSDAPKSFRGAPILLVAAALVAMAFSGFYGMKP